MRTRGERMKKIIVFLLIAGIVLGMIIATERICEESSSSSMESLCDIVEDIGDNPTPYGGGGGGGGGGAPG